jgi:excisionase family DNA binding protein
MAKQLPLSSPEVLNFSEAARYTGLSRPTFRQHLSAIPHRRAGRRILIRREALDRWLEGHDGEAA